MAEIYVTLAKGDDWQGLYVDGMLAAEDHNVSASEALKVVSVYSCKFSFKEVIVDYDWLANQGSMPDSEEDLVLV